jgi:RNA polymerase sigma-70 factor (ECF subfamily)
VTSDSDDASLLAAHVAGDADAFAELVRRHRDRLWAVALRTTGDREEAADAVQDALLSAFRRAEGFRGDAQVSTWLHRIVVNACLDRMRRRKARPTDPLPEEEDRVGALADATSAGDPAEAGERRADVLSALAELNEDQRTAVVLVDMEGYSIDEVAELMDCAPGTVKSRCARGRARLVPLLSQYRSAQDASAQVRPARNEPDAGNHEPPDDVQPADTSPQPCAQKPRQASSIATPTHDTGSTT